MTMTVQDSLREASEGSIDTHDLYARIELKYLRGMCGIAARLIDGKNCEILAHEEAACFAEGGERCR